MDTVWSFKTRNFEVRLRVEPCLDEPDWYMTADEKRELQREIERGDVAWFDATVEVLKGGYVVGRDSLGQCCYKTVQEFYTAHRDANPMNRNCSIMRAAKHNKAFICHYFPSLVVQAIDATRGTLNIETAKERNNLNATVAREYGFDVTLSAFARVQATSEEEARRKLREVADCMDISYDEKGVLFTEASACDEVDTLVEIDGEAV